VKPQPKSTAQLAAELVAECRKQGYLVAMREALRLLEEKSSPTQTSMYGRGAVVQELRDRERAVYEDRRSV
jgi:hypothetical protein